RSSPPELACPQWAQRIDPVRARIENIPFAKSGYHFGDLVLHDGAPVGYRMRGDQEVPVFNTLELFQASPYGTYEADVVVGAAPDLEALQELCAKADLAFEDWEHRSARSARPAAKAGRTSTHMSTQSMAAGRSNATSRSPHGRTRKSSASSMPGG